MVTVGVIGVGALGQHHARLYAGLPGVRLVGVCDLRPEVGQSVADRYGVAYFADWQDLAARVMAVSVAVPTCDHCTLSVALLSQGKHVLVEKPIAVTLEEAGQMIAAAEQAGVILQVGHLERFNPALQAAQALVCQPRFFEIDRLSVFTPRSLDIDVVADVMIHDLDLLRWMVDAPVATIHAVGVPALTEKVDIASARIEFANGCVANVTASRVSLDKVRKLRCFHAGGYVSVDCLTQQVTALEVVRSQGAAAPPAIVPRAVTVAPDEPLRAELEHFITCIRQGRQPLVDGRAGQAALELALQVRAEITAHARRAGLGHWVDVPT
ncbi:MULTISPECIES: Gfo/Idh/MocA family protein [Chloracidobacterium]|jgi:predicted dehydrogenase|uniref:Putative dehydrogenase-like protein n=1 Tax=Chloracidobacterium thermophilum (strain B) TaxID=981222 RepID=G2LIL6_CHLTF|nr:MULTISPECIES: Gfo/Idh/MocA family oxidoreductase [Chloracidobacterium]AEP11914.1 putative dehydrogenase-like protein [Chloracidobacterium thermophilum B]QUV77674.1 Gfo/Idh/MocA family oxidoreductase [Chloracidobacterium thermophilum]QUV80739.1 Gfo/Idh/MocA family oxidoreductase [Chloracidobacterium sp. D]